MKARSFDTKTGKYIRDRKCSESSQCRDPKAAKHLGQFGLLKHFDRLVAKEIERVLVPNDKFGSSCKRRDKRAIADADRTCTLEQSKAWAFLIS
jgi:hypothetical protein